MWLAACGVTQTSRAVTALGSPTWGHVVPAIWRPTPPVNRCFEVTFLPVLGSVSGGDFRRQFPRSRRRCPGGPGDELRGIVPITTPDRPRDPGSCKVCDPATWSPPFGESRPMPRIAAAIADSSDVESHTVTATLGDQPATAPSSNAPILRNRSYRWFSS